MEISPGFKWVSFKQNDTLLHKVFIKSFESVRKLCFPNVHFLYLPLPKPSFTCIYQINEFELVTLLAKHYASETLKM